MCLDENRLMDYFSNVVDLLEQSAEKYGERIAIQPLSSPGISYQELFEKVTNIALHIVSSDIPSQRIAVVAPNGAEMSIAILAAISAGVAVPLNPTFTTSEYYEYFRVANVNSLLIMGGKDHNARVVANEMALEIFDLERLESQTPTLGKFLPLLKPEQLALIMLTSGSTGRSKVVPLTHRNIFAAARDVCNSIDLNKKDRCLCMWEQFHIGGIVDLLLAPLLSGGEIIAAGSFNAMRFFEIMNQYQPTWFQCVPATAHELQSMVARNGLNSRHNSLRLIRCVAAKLPEMWRIEIERSFNVPVICTFGMTEASPLITSTRLKSGIVQADSVGFSCGTEIKIAGQDGESLPANMAGEVAIRGENVFSGYEGDPELNVECFRGGWFYTGDLGYLGDDGQLYITGRVKDIINRGGEKISPGEVEAVFLSHPEVKQAVAFANPHKTLGYDVGIAIVLKEGAQVNRQQLERHARSRLSQFKVPKAWLFLNQLPHNMVGKVQRNELPKIYRQYRDQSTVLNYAAKNDIENILLNIWRKELDSPLFQINEDFFDGGGDSLSSLRIVLAVESLFEISLPDDIVMRCTTVEKMAVELQKMGVLKVVRSQKKSVAQIERWIDDFNPAKLEMASGNILYLANNKRAFNAIRHSLGTLTTPAEILELLKYRPALADRFSHYLKAPVIAFKLSRERSRLKHSIMNDVCQAISPMSWERKQVSQHAFLFSAPSLTDHQSILIVGFASRAMRLTTSTYNILATMDPSKHSLLLLRDPWQAHFENGVPGIGESIEKIADWLKDFSVVRSYSEVIAIGTSAGGVPALIATLRNNWSRVLLAGADAPSSHPLLKQALYASLDNKMAGCPSVVVAYSARNRRDQLGAQEIKQFLPRAMLVPDDRFKEHALLHELYIRGELRSFLDRYLFHYS